VLENTFIHLPDYGATRERKLWRRGVRSWDDFLSSYGDSPYVRNQCTIIAGSQHALRSRDVRFFAQALPRGESWRAFPSFPNAVYLDIETTGLGHGTDHSTVVGLYDGQKTMSFIHGQNMGDLPAALAKYETVVTFNGSMFDLPFLKKEMVGIRLPPLHVDLRFVLASLNIHGGLKRIEQSFGLEREDDLKGLNGYDAVLMWKAYKKRGDKDALDRLVRYNAADIGNLKFLMEWAYKEKRKQTGFDDPA